MSDSTENQMNDEPPRQLDELSILKERARMMNIPFSNNISVETLRAKIQAAQDGEEDTPPLTGTVFSPNAPNRPLTKEENRTAVRELLIREKMKLVRVQIANLDPKKKDIPGEIFTVANGFLGTVRKYIPYGERTDDGYHIPQILLDQLKAKKFLHVNTRTNSDGRIQVDQRWVREFAINVLPPLTNHELADLAQAQLAAGVFATE